MAAAGNPFSSAPPSSISIFEVFSNRHFLVHSGADDSVYPASSADRTLTNTSSLVAANGSSISTYGRREIPISFRSGHLAKHWVWIADDSKPILGASFFKDVGLLIDLPNRRLVSARSPTTTFPAVSSRRPGVNGLRLPTQGPYEDLLLEFPSLLLPQFTG